MFLKILLQAINILHSETLKKAPRSLIPAQEDKSIWQEAKKIYYKRPNENSKV